MKKVVYTVITAGKDALKGAVRNPEWDYVCFTDDPGMKAEFWEIRPLPSAETNSRRRSRLPKMLPHRYFEGYSHSIYLDGHIELVCDPENLVAVLGGNDIAFFRHYRRDCIYDEAAAVLTLKREKSGPVSRQIERYWSEGYPANNGLINGQVIVRRHTEPIAALNQLWWDVYSSYSERDQLAFNYCAWKLGVPYSKIPGSTYEPNPFVKIHEHAYPAVLNWAYMKKVIRKAPFDPAILSSLWLYFKMRRA